MRHIYIVTETSTKQTVYSSKSKASGHFRAVADSRIAWLSDFAIVWDMDNTCQVGTIRKTQVF